MGKKQEAIGDTARRLIREGATNEEALAGVLRLHPGAKTTLKSVHWYRWRMRDDFEEVPEAKDAPGLTSAVEDEPPAPGPVATENVRLDRAHGDQRASALALLRDVLKQWRTNDQARALVREVHPDVRLTSDDVRTIRAELRRSGQYVPTSAEARRFHVGELRPTDPVPPKHISVTR